LGENLTMVLSSFMIFIGFVIMITNQILYPRRLEILKAVLRERNYSFSHVDHFFFLNIKCNIELVVQVENKFKNETEKLFASMGSPFYGLLSKRVVFEEFPKNTVEKG